MVETAESIAIIVASLAISVVAVMLVIALGYAIFILRHVADSVKQLKSTARKIGKDVSGAISMIAGGRD